MDVARPEYRPDPGLSVDEMTAMQREIADVAVFADDHGLDPDALGIDEPIDREAATGPQTALADATSRDGPVVVGVDQAFTDESAVSAAVAIRDGAVVERATGRAPLEQPYVPGLLSFREGEAVVDALSALTIDPDLLVFDGNGRLHYREAGLATHLGVLFDAPAVGVAKSLLCGTPIESVADRHLDAGERVAITANGRVSTCPNGTTIGFYYQSKQYSNPERRHVNPLVVSPGHRVAVESAVDLVAACCAGYRLPEPTRIADAAVDGLA